MIYSYILLLLINLFILTKSYNNVWKHQLWLDPLEKYSVKWNTNDLNETITFKCEVQTKGWIGFGLSPNGGMKGSDIIMGWVDDNDGKTYFNDRYAVGESVPEIDESQDWTLIDSNQNSTHTSLIFSRPYTTCDKQYDRDITRDTTRIIYAYNDFDPKSDGKIRVHRRHERGAKSVDLLSNTDSFENDSYESHVKTFTINYRNITIPKKENTYWCKIFKLPDDKKHIIKFEPFITTGNEPFIHHMTVSTCFHPDFKLLDKYISDEGIDCTDEANMPEDYGHCFNPYFMWGVGGGAFSLPENVGFPLGENLSNTYLLLNIHYDNPELVENRTDSSGLKFYFTKQFRKYEASILSTGSSMDNRFFVPPNQSQFHISGHCHTQCFKDMKDQDGINAFAVWPHAHLLATSMKVRHFRNDEELEWISNDINYDFNLQVFRALSPMTKIMTGDQITVECVYDSRTRNKTTLGGFATRDEMCTAFIYYYPRMTKARPCFSVFTSDTAIKLAAIETISINVSEEYSHPLRNQKLIQYLIDKQDWNQSIIEDSKNIMLNAMQKPECYWIKTPDDKDIDSLIGYPKVKTLYEPKQKQCVSSVKQMPVKDSQYLLYFSFVLLFILIAFLIYTFKCNDNPIYTVGVEPSRF